MGLVPWAPFHPRILVTSQRQWQMMQRHTRSLPICKLDLFIWAAFRKAALQGGEKEVIFDKAAFQNLMNGQI